MPDNKTAIQIENISKTFSGGIAGKKVQALIDVSLTVSEGDIFGLLGPNGAGKTTLVKILLGALRASSGSAYINNREIKNWRARKNIGFLPENHRFPQYLTGMQMLYHFGGMTGLSRRVIKSKADQLLKLVGMHEWRDTKIKKYSKGMMQRLGLAQTLLNDPEIIFLDEPTDGVDPIGRHEIRNVLVNLKKQGKTIFLNSHLLAEVESVCDKVAILNKGKLVKAGPIAELISIKPAYKVIAEELPDEIAQKINEKFPVAKIDGNEIEIILDESENISQLIDFLRDNSIGIISAAPVKVSLEESFMQLVKGVSDE
jgi:ABC-2 type transport system ATP-binding protein